MATSICHVSSVHPLDHLRIVKKLAGFQAKAGCKVHYVAYQDEKEGVMDDPPSGVTLIPMKRTSNKRIVRASLDALRVIWQGWKTRSDIVVLHDPELIPFGVILVCLGRKVIFDAHEDHFRQNKKKAWASGWKRPLILGYTWLLQKMAGLFFGSITVVTDGVAERFPAHKTHVLPNLPIKGELVDSKASPMSLRQKRAIYVGALSRERGIKEIIEAAGLSKELAVLDLVGTFPDPEFHTQLSTMPEWPKICFHGHVNREELRKLLGKARVGLCVLHPTPNHLISWPIKVMEYFSAGLPVVLSDFTAWRKIVDSQKTGVFVKYDKPSEIAKAIDKCLNEPEMAQFVSDGPQASLDWETAFQQVMNDLKIT